MNSPQEIFDYILVGGGLQAGLLALAIDYYQPNATVLILERGKQLFGNHTWSFHQSDISNEWKWLGNLPVHRWPAYTVHFPGFQRQVDLPYCTISSEQFATVIEKKAAASERLQIKTGVEATSVGQNKVNTTETRSFVGQTVIDCRGHASSSLDGVGYQKFFGREIELEEDWPSSIPVLMEANLDQSDGFRFLYVLPFEPRRVLIEDTHFSESPELNKEDSIEQITAYLERNSSSSWRIAREEQGCLPMPYHSLFKPSASDQLAGGFAGGWFHAATGYSFPLAARFANTIALGPPELAYQRVKGLVRANRFQANFSRLLNRLLFQLVSPEKRFEIFRRFYNSLPPQTIQRFYAHAFTKTDAARILIGSPPSGLTPIRFLQSLRR